MNVWAGSWLIWSVYIERMMQMSSAILPCCGKKSLISWPALAVLLELGAAARGTLSFCPWSWAIGWPLVNDSGIGLPSSSASFGL